MAKTIELKDVGAIVHLSIPIPEKGGVVVLRGGQGTGKSTAIRVVSKALGAGKVAGLGTRDGSRRGTLEFGDVRLTVTKARTTRKGELEVAELESRLDISALVDPGIEDPDRADMARIKALVSLTGVKADPSAYYELLGGKEVFEAIGVSTETEDPIELAGHVKRALELRARQEEKLADVQAGHAQACVDQIADLNLSAPCDKKELELAYDQAKECLARLEERRRLAMTDADSREEAGADLEEAEQSYQGSTKEESAAERDKAVVLLQELESEVAEFQLALNESKKSRDIQRVKVESLTEKADAAESHFDTLLAWRKILQKPAFESPGDAAIQEATFRVSECREDMDDGVRVRDGKATRIRGEEHSRRAKELASYAQTLRDAARGVDEVLSQAVPSSVLRVEDGRLVTATDRSRSELYAELSRGEKWKLAIDLACEQLPKDGVLCIPQEAWEGLQPANQQLIVDHARKREVTILTGQATDGELEAIEYDG